MANSDHEDFIEISSTSPSIVDFADGIWTEQGPAWCKTQSTREFRRRRYTMSHVAPPAPPSTPTLLTSGASTDSTSPTPASSAMPESNRFNQFYYVTTGSKNLPRDSRCSEAELAELFNVVTITNRLAASNNNASIRQRSNKLHTDRGIRNASRTISKLNGATKIFKIHRNPKEFLREPDEDSVSAPEYDEEEDRHRLWRFKRTRRFMQTRRERKYARFEHQERMETIVDVFDAAMSFNDADATEA